MKNIIGGAAVIENEGKHFLIKQSKNKSLGGKWRHPGGKFQTHETDKNGLIREIKEETGFTILVKGKVPVHLEKSDYQEGYFGFYKALIKEGNLNIDAGEIEDYGWFTLDEIKKLDLMKATRSFYNKIYNL